MVENICQALPFTLCIPSCSNYQFWEVCHNIQLLQCCFILVQSYEYETIRYDIWMLDRWLVGLVVCVFVFSDADALLDLLVYFRSFAWGSVVVQLSVIMTLFNASGMQPLEHAHDTKRQWMRGGVIIGWLAPNPNTIFPLNFYMKSQKKLLVFLSISFWLHFMWHRHMMQIHKHSKKTHTLILSKCSLLNFGVLCSNYNHAYSQTDWMKGFSVSMVGQIAENTYTAYQMSHQKL